MPLVLSRYLSLWTLMCLDDKPANQRRQTNEAKYSTGNCCTSAMLDPADPNDSARHRVAADIPRSLNEGDSGGGELQSM